MKAITTRKTSTPPALSGEQLTAAIRQEHEAASAAAGAALGHALEAGRLLAEARPAIPHGAWESYVRESCGIAPRTASLYLRLHRNRDRLPNRQHVADLSVRQAARLLEQPKVKTGPVTEAGPAFDFLGESYCSMTSVGCQFNPKWIALPFQKYADMVAEAWGVEAPKSPAWYAAGHRHSGHHASGWTFEVMPDPAAEGRVNAIAHDAEGTLHLATFDGMNAAGILPFLTACERHHGMPAIGPSWTLTATAMPPATVRLAEPFRASLFRLAMLRDHRCCCWMLVDAVLGLERLSSHFEAGMFAWAALGSALGEMFGRGKPLGDFDGSSMWWLGDVLNHGNRKSPQGASA